ncbi:hypothetical protein pdam_00008599, partial [Pocillopora damicornis]
QWQSDTTTALPNTGNPIAVNAGASEHDFFEFSEWIVRSSPHNIWLVIVYRPPYSEEHRVPVDVFLCAEFPEYLESLLLCKEKLLIMGDFNIQVNDPQDSDARKGPGSGAAC